MIEELWNQQKLEVADEIFSADATAPDLPQLPPGPMGTKIVAQMFLGAFPDLKMVIEDIVAEEDRVAVRSPEATWVGKGIVFAMDSMMPRNGDQRETVVQWQ